MPFVFQLKYAGLVILMGSVMSGCWVKKTTCRGLHNQMPSSCQDYTNSNEPESAGQLDVPTSGAQPTDSYISPSAPSATTGEIEKQDFLTSAAVGPKEAIEAVLTSDALKNLRLNKSSTVSVTQTVTYNFNADINPILENSCGGSECHSQGNSRSTASAYVNSESAFKVAPGIRISNGSMPPANSGKTLTSEEKNKLLIFLGQ